MPDKLISALRDAGLTDEKIDLVIENKCLADAVANLIADVCRRFERTVAITRCPSRRGPMSSVSPDDVRAAVEAIQRRGERVSQKKVAKQLGKGSSYQATLSRTAELRAAYESALLGLP